MHNRQTQISRLVKSVTISALVPLGDLESLIELLSLAGNCLALVTLQVLL